ncbi:MAG: glycosyltransferase [Methanoregula sp.]
MHILIPAIIDIRKTAPNRLHQFIKYLSKNHDITVVCINDFWKAGQVDTNRHYQDFDDILSNIKIHYITYKKMSPILQEFFSPVLLHSLENERYDVIFNYNTLVSGKYLAKKFRIPMVYDIADDLPAMIRDSPQIPRSLGRIGHWFGEVMIKKNIAVSQAVTGITEIFREKYSIPRTKFHLIPNGVNTDLFKPVKSNVKTDLGLDNAIVLGYVGVLREWVDLTPVYQILRESNNYKLLVVGQEGLFTENKAIVKDLSVEEKVIFTGNIHYNKVPEYIAAMDICLIPFKNNDISQNAVPLKLFEYMACGKPIISSHLTGIRQIAGNKIFYADLSNEYNNLLKKICKADQNLLSLIESNRKFVENFYTWNSSGRSLETIMKGVL